VAPMDGITVGVFGTDQEARSALESAIAKKSEAEGIAVYTRTEGGKRYSFLDTADYPGRIQGYATIASFCDHGLYLFPKSGKLSAPDGELAVLLGSFGIPGTMEIMDGVASPDYATSLLKGTLVARYRFEERQSGSSAIDLSYALPRTDLPKEKPLVYIDRVFTVKGVGTVALGFVLSGSVSVHDQLRPVPGPEGLRADVKGIQVNDVDFESAGRGIRVGLSLRGVEPKDLDRSHWLDDGSFAVSDAPSFEMSKSPFYRHEVSSRDMHLQIPGEMVPAKLSAGEGGLLVAQLPWQVPVWEGMRGAVVDLNGGTLRVAGGLAFKF
jgi:selenocysteine-specific translation elongation factor